MQHRLILGLDSSAGHIAGALIARTDQPGETGLTLLAKNQEIMKRGQAERLLPFLEELVASADAELAQLSAIGVGVGPGNFTGIRIGVSAARGMALGLNVPAIGVTGFEAAGYRQPFPYTVSVPAPRDLRYHQVMDVTPGVPALGPAAAPAPDHIRFEDIPPQDIAAHIAEIAAMRFTLPDQARPKPLYIKPADAAPARDLGPVLIA